MYLCIDAATCVKSISLIPTQLSSKCNIRSVCLDFLSFGKRAGPAPESVFLFIYF